MKLPCRAVLVFAFQLSVLGFVSGQSTVILSGYVRDAASGESLPGANVFDLDDPALGTTTNPYGFFSLTLPAGPHTLRISYLGYRDTTLQLDLRENTRLNVALEPGITIQEVVVRSDEGERALTDPGMGTVALPVENIRQLPVVFGEIDVLKTLQLLPGVLSAQEGNAGFYVRGGGPDQNLILLDEAVVYNSGHMLGFFSVFNGDAIKNTTLIKGGMPARYGGRVSSVVDIQMKEGNDKKLGVSGGIGLIASRLTVEGPLKKERSSFILSGRRTYAFDLAQPLLDNTDFAGTNYFFYDLNAKVNHRFSDRDRLFLSAYFGRDVLRFRASERDFFFDLPYGNQTATLRWNHLFGDRLFLNLSAVFNEYEFEFHGGQDDFVADVYSGVRDWNLKADFDFYPTPEHHLRFGTNYTWHRLTPNVASATNGEENFSNDLLPVFAHESSLYLSDEWQPRPHLTLYAGLRLNYFLQTGPYTSKLDGRTYEKGEPVKGYLNPEPRLSLAWRLDARNALKAGLTLANQYIHLVSNSTNTLPADVWVPSTERVKPQTGWQYALGWFRNFPRKDLEASVELYYKALDNQIDYREDYVNDIADDLENEFVFGSGRSYGLELFLKKRSGRLNGWVGYTLAKTERTFPDINEGKTFPATYDRRHDLSIVAQYRLNDRWTLAATFVYGTGNAFTPLKSLYFIERTLNPEFGARNSARLEPYHRLDLSATLHPKNQKDKPWKSSWTFALYNAYNRKNTFFLFYDFQTNFEQGTARAEAFKVALFPIIPSVTWNFRR